MVVLPSPTLELRSTSEMTSNLPLHYCSYSVVLRLLLHRLPPNLLCGLFRTSHYIPYFNKQHLRTNLSLHCSCLGLPGLFFVRLMASSYYKTTRSEPEQSKKISNDKELIQSNHISCPQNQKGNNLIHKLTAVYERHAR